MKIEEDDFLSLSVVEPNRSQIRALSQKPKQPNRDISAELHAKTNGHAMSASPARDKAEKPTRGAPKSGSQRENGKPTSQKPPVSDNNTNSATSETRTRVNSRQGLPKQPAVTPSAVDNRYGNRSPAPKAQPSRPSSRRETPRSSRRNEMPRPVSRKGSAVVVHNLTLQVRCDLSTQGLKICCF